MEKGGGKKWLVAALIVLTVVIVALIISIIIVNANKTAETSGAGEEESSVYEEMPEGVADDFKKANEASERYDEFGEMVQTMLNKTPVDESAIVKAYNDAIQYEITSGNDDWVIEYLMHASGVLGKRAQLYKAALDVFDAVDISSLFTDPDLYRVSDEAVIMAEGANDEEAKVRYEAIRKGAEAEYLREAEVTQRNIDNRVNAKEDQDEE